MGETTDRLVAAAALRDKSFDEAEDKKRDRAWTRANIIWGIVVFLLMGAFAIGRNLMTRQEADSVFVRRDVYARDYENTTKQLDAIEGKIDKVAEAVNARQ